VAPDGWQRSSRAEPVHRPACEACQSGSVSSGDSSGDNRSAISR
jgi:hypothetical protein